MSENIFLPDPEGIPEEEAEITYRLQETVHWYVNYTGSGLCQEPVRKFCYEHKVTDYHNECGLEKWSVLHVEEQERHDCDGCQSCEGEPW